MLELKNISKEYRTGAETVHALRGIDLAFRESEFVSILGPSGCGKTTMLNILGGLDQYTDGDLIIDGISTKEYKDADWDAYRNDAIGFVFQSYNLISHQTVLSNVELALTLSGVSTAERRQRAVKALEQVGLGDQINKKPAQMSGGQVQRVAIARALINDPDIILADEPTGALDSETSLQIMSILKDISERKLVIMVTHNPELAETYSTRIVRLSDGQVISDSDPFVPGAAPLPVSGAVSLPDGSAASAPAAAIAADTADITDKAEDLAGTAISAGAVSAAAPPAKKSRRARRRRNKSMSMGTALHLSLNNLMTKKARTLLTAFAGSIGIIGIALILSVSNGFQHYIDKLEEDTLSSYPLTIQSETADMTSMITAFAAAEAEDDGESRSDKIREQQIMSEMLGSIGSNDLKSFRNYIESNIDRIGSWFNYHAYTYGISPTIYSTDMTYGPLRVSPGSIMQSYMNSIQVSMISYANTDVFFQMMDNRKLLESQYDVIAGKWPDNYDELLLVLQHEDELNDYIVYTLGLRDPQELKDMINEVMKGNEVSVDNEPLEWTYDDFIGKEFALIHACDTFRRNKSFDVWEDMTDDEDFMEDLIKRSEKLHISGIVCPKDPNGANSMSMGIGYLPSLTEHMFEYAGESEIVRLQLADKDTDIFSGKSFEDIRNDTDEGLGFDDMIGIDENKLRNALGGNIDPKAIEKSIRKTGDDEFKELVAMDSAEKIEEDVNAAVRKGCNGMVDYILEQAEKDPEHFNLDNDMVTMALAANMDTGKHKAVVNQLLKAYSEVLKQAGEQIMAAIAANSGSQGQAQPSDGQSSGDDQGSQDSQDSQAAAIAQIKAAMSQMGIQLSDEQAAQILTEGITAEALKELAQQSGRTLPDAMAAQIAQRINAMIEEASSEGQDPEGDQPSGGDQPAPPAMSLADMLEPALRPTVEAFAGADSIADGIEKYSKGIEQMQIAQQVYPALGKVAQAIGSQFKIDPSGIADAFTMKMNEEEITRLITAYVSGDKGASYEANLRKLGYARLDKPAAMAFYLKDFASKEKFLDFIDEYNKEMQDNGDEDLVISYTDITGVMMKSVKTITNAVSYVLIAFVAISLIVSSIMIGVITYISVLERTTEIGILRAIGASKKDISRIFNAETIIVGLCAGVIGIVASLLLLIPINKILLSLTGIKALRAVLPPVGGVALILISIFLTFIAGLIPSGMAARKDPVVALRTE